MQLETLNRTFPVAEKPGLDTLDPRWDEISGLVQAGDFAAAAQQSEALLKEDVCDVRLVGYFAFGAFLEQGLPSLGPALQGIADLLGNQWDNVGPAATRVKATQTSLAWLVKQLQRKLQREEELKAEAWQQWTTQIDSDGVEAVLTALTALQRSLGAKLEDAASPILEPLGKVRDWLQAFRQVVYKPPEPEPEPEAATEESAGSARSQRDADAISAEGSYHLQVLLRKMAAFERLISEEKFPRARIVADDIHETIASFDPVLYFPALFRTFLKLMAMHTGELSGFDEARESPDWKALVALYRVDLDEFLEL